MNLQPLECPTCAAAVPLGDGATAKCPYCAAEIPIPPAYLTVRDEDRALIEARAEAAKLIAKLATPLPLPVRAFAFLGIAVGYVALGLFALAFLLGFILAVHEGGGGGLLTLIFAVFVALLAVPMAWEWLLRALADRLHVDLVDRLSGFGAHLLFGLVVTLFVLVPVALGFYARTLVAAHARLRASFASKPPARPGGPATCRHCDAPLDVPAGALGVRCLYCGADNLVGLSTEMVKAAVGASANSHRALADAVGEQTGARRDLKAQLKALPIAAAVLVPLFGGLGLMTECVMDEGSTPSHMTCASGAPMLYGNGPRRPQGEVALDCDALCTFYVPLARGQQLVVRAPHEVTIERREIGHWYQLDWWGWMPLEPGPVRHTGWYRIVATVSKPGEKLTWSVETVGRAATP